MPDKPGRNDPCPCGSGKKYKNCCMGANKIEEQQPLKFKAKVIQSSTQPAAEQQQQPKKDHYTVLMERAFGQVIYTEEPPPIPEDPSIYLPKQ